MYFDRKRFWEKYREEFGRAGQEVVDAIEFLLARFEIDDTWKRIQTIAYAFATIKHETAHTYRPITEYGGVKYFDKYDVGQLARRLGNTPEKDGDGYKYRGRGFVQLTGKSNYQKYGIAHKPERALDPVKAFEIMTDGMHTGNYTGKKLADYITARKTDYLNARRIINGIDKAVQIAGYAKQFEAILTASVLAAPVPELANPAFNPNDNPAGSSQTPDVQATPDVDSTQAPSSSETIIKGEIDTPNGSASIEQTNTSFNPETIPQYIPKMKGVRNWFGTLSLGGIASTTYAAFNDLPPMVIFALGMVTMAVVLGFVFVVVKYRENLFDLVKHVVGINADPESNNIELTSQK